LENVNAQAVAKVVEEEFAPKFQAAGGKIVFRDNDKTVFLFCFLKTPDFLKIVVFF